MGFEQYHEPPQELPEKTRTQLGYLGRFAGRVGHNVAVEEQHRGVLTNLGHDMEVHST